MAFTAKAFFMNATAGARSSGAHAVAVQRPGKSTTDSKLRVTKPASVAFRSSVRGCALSQRKNLVSCKRFAPSVRSVLEHPAEEDTKSEEIGEKEWARVTPNGIKKATTLYEGAQKKQSKGEWNGQNKTKQVLFSDVIYSSKRNKYARKWVKEDIIYTSFILAMHLIACAAPFCFSWANFGYFIAGWVVTGMFGITYSFHRQLSHKSFKSPKWLEYIMAYCGVLAVQGDPIEWVSSHRYHHANCDTPDDPHTPYEGFWWSHCGWFLDAEATLARVSDRSNASDMASQPFYTHLQKHYGWHVLGSALLTYALLGASGFVWAFALRVCWVHHITWFVNSAAHVWGTQPYNTGDLSRNNWWVGILAFGEGWHNNHHAFEFSARHGLEWWQFDPTWYTIRLFKALGLVTNVKLPSENQLRRLAVVPAS